jgi:nucleoside-diphosphate-sugar epimerase
MRLIVVGARGFIGSAILSEARARNLEVSPRAADDVAQGDADATIVYVSGVASGAEASPMLAYRRHVMDAGRWAATPHRSFIYISSTRVYDGAKSTSENALLPVDPARATAYVNSKIAGESVVLGTSPRAHVLRLSNVAGPSVTSELFLSDVLRQVATTGEVALRSGLESAKDYVDVRDVAAWTLDIAVAGGPRILNLARGENITHGVLLRTLAASVTFRVTVADNSPTIVVPPIDVSRRRATLHRPARDPLAELGGYFSAFAERY